MVKNKSISTKINAFLGLAVLIAGLILINVLAENIYKRFDLTKEKRFTLSESTQELAEKVDDVLYVQVFLDGEFPKEYKRLRNATRDMLDEFRNATNGNLEYKFENILGDKEKKEKEDILRELSQKGLLITRPEIGDDEAISDRYIVPSALVYYRNQEYALNLLQVDFGQSLEMNINNSIEKLEYEIGNVMRQCVKVDKVKLAFLVGHEELEFMEVADITKDLETFYHVDRLNINIMDTACVAPYLSKILDDTARSGEIFFTGLMKTLNSYDALIVAKPRLNFLDQELFLLDQYVMNGGNIIWLVETLNAEMDSVAKYGNIMTADYNLNLDAMLFRYGVRVNPTLIQDLQSHQIPVVSRSAGNRPMMKDWFFYPIFEPQAGHPITNNVQPIWSKFAASIDTLPNKNLKKTILLRSSSESRVANNPVNISLHAIDLPRDPKNFQKPNQIAGVLVEGTFKSVFAHRPAVRNEIPIPYKNEVKNGQMIVLSDGDLIANAYKVETKEIFPLGFDPKASKYKGKQVQFANSNFFLNCVDYLCDESNLIEVRNKKIEMRLLNKVKIKEEKLKWQTINMVLPIVLIILFGLINGVIRRRKYT
jgi:gliding-associated putative ABC transporter substrate-binding component GldG